MDLALSIARSGLEAQHENIEIISNNLANASTISYKKSRASFEDLPYVVTKQPGAPTSVETNSPTGFLMGTGTRVIGNAKIYSDGDLSQTKKPLDVAIQGRGFFQVQLPNGGGFAYTRAGSFNMTSTGQLVTQQGYLVQPAITFPTGAQNITIAADGVVSCEVPPAAASQIGQLQLADFINPDGLEPIGGNLYLATISSGTETLNNPQQVGLGQLYQGQIEGSNVNVVEEMVNLIEAQRAFEVTSKAVSAVDQMMQNLSRVT